MSDARVASPKRQPVSGVGVGSGPTAARPSTDRRLAIAIAVLCVIGIGIASYLTYVHYAGLKVLCLSSGGCETVQASKYAKLDGIPVAVRDPRRYRPRRRLRDRPDRLPVQPVPDLPRAVHDQGDLPMVRGERSLDDAAGDPHRRSRTARRPAF